VSIDYEPDSFVKYQCLTHPEYDQEKWKMTLLLTKILSTLCSEVSAKGSTTERKKMLLTVVRKVDVIEKSSRQNVLLDLLVILIEVRG